MSVKQILSGSFWSTADSFVNRLAIIVATNILMARALSPAGFGIFSTAMTAVQTLWVVTDFGVSQYGIREIARNPGAESRHRVACELFTFRVIMACAVYAVMALAVLAAPSLAGWRTPMLLAGLYVVFYSLYPDWYFKGMGRFREMALTNLFSSVLYVAGVALIVRGRENMPEAFVLWACSFLPGSLLLLLRVYREDGPLFRMLRREDLSRIVGHLAETKYFLATAVFSNLYMSLPVYILTMAHGPEETGLFNSAYRLYIYISSILLPVSTVFYTYFSRDFARLGIAGLKAKQMFFQRMAFALLLPFVIIAAMFGKDVILLLYGSEFERGAVVMSLLSLPILLSSLRLTMSNPIAASGMQKGLAWVTFGVAAFSAVSGSLLIWRMGLAGAAVNVLLCELVYVAALVRLSRSCVSMSLGDMLSGCSWRMVAGLGVMVVVIRAWGSFSAASLAFGCTSYAVSLLALGEVNVFRRMEV